MGRLTVQRFWQEQTLPTEVNFRVHFIRVLSDKENLRVKS
jgi:hypothetical protein